MRTFPKARTQQPELRATQRIVNGNFFDDAGAKVSVFHCHACPPTHISRSRKATLLVPCIFFRLEYLAQNGVMDPPQRCRGRSDWARAPNVVHRYNRPSVFRTPSLKYRPRPKLKRSGRYPSAVWPLPDTLWSIQKPITIRDRDCPISRARFVGGSPSV